MASVFALTDGCGDEVDVNNACVIRTPPITCSTYDLYNSTNELNVDDGTMSEVITGSGVYNFTFNQSDLGIHTIVLCDNTSTSLNVKATIETLILDLNASIPIQCGIESFRLYTQNLSVVPLVNLSSGLLINETQSYADGTTIVTTFIYNLTDFRILNSSSVSNN